MGWNNEGGKHFGLVCATHDKKLGRTNLIDSGMSTYEAIMFEHYLKLTVDNTNPIDWPEWFATQTTKNITSSKQNHKRRRIP